MAADTAEQAMKQAESAARRQEVARGTATYGYPSGTVES